MYIKEYLVQKGFREEWFDDTGTIARIDSNFLSDIFFKIFNSEHNKLFYFTPFNKEDRTGSRKLWLHNIFLPNLTKIKLDKELQYNSQFMSMFVGPANSPNVNIRGIDDFKFDHWYTLDYDPLFCPRDYWMLRDQENKQDFYIIWMVFFTYITQVQVKND